MPAGRIGKVGVDSPEFQAFSPYAGIGQAARRGEAAFGPTAALAERKGFEPSIPLPVYTLSRGAPSTTRPPPRTALAVNERPSYRDFARAQGERPIAPLEGRLRTGQVRTPEMPDRNPSDAVSPGRHVFGLSWIEVFMVRRTGEPCRVANIVRGLYRLRNIELMALPVAVSVRRVPRALHVRPGGRHARRLRELPAQAYSRLP